MKKEYVVELSEEEADELMDEHWVCELVRCKECTHAEHCGIYAGWDEQDPEWFCAYGEREDNDA